MTFNGDPKPQKEQEPGLNTIDRGKTVDLVTARDIVHIKTCCSPEFIAGLEFDEGLGNFPQYRAIIRHEESFQRIAEAKDGNVVLAYTDEGKIVGYAVFGYPGPGERWSRGGELLYEMGAIEVSRVWRGYGIAGRMMNAALDDDFLEDKIIIVTCYSWHWDLAGTGLSKQQYREKLIRLFSRIGFRHTYTTEPNIMMDLANALLVRVGSRVSWEEQDNFLALLFMSDGSPRGTRTPLF